MNFINCRSEEIQISGFSLIEIGRKIVSNHEYVSRSRFTLMVLVMPEEKWALQSIKQICDRAKRPSLSWNVAVGKVPLFKGDLSLINQFEINRHSYCLKYRS